MADCIWALISANIVTTGAGITGIALCEQERMSDRTNGVFPRLELAGPAITLSSEEEGVNSTGKQKCKLEYSFLYYDRINDEQSTTDPASKQTRNVPADIIKALMVDHTRGGYAVMTTATDAYPTIDFIGDVPVFLWVITFEVDTFIDMLNPYSN